MVHKRGRRFGGGNENRHHARTKYSTCTVQLYCTTAAWQCITKSQPRTGHTREPDPTHNELKHTTTRKTASHERTPADKPHVHTHTHTPPATLPQPPPRASAPARGTTIACASSTDLSASASARWSLPCCCTCRSRCYDSALFPYARYSTVARLKLACSERLASHYNSDMTGLIEPGYSCVRLLTRPNPDYRKSSFPTEETILRVPLL